LFGHTVSGDRAADSAETLKSPRREITPPMSFWTPLALGPSTIDALAILAVAIGIAGVAILILFSKDHI